MKRTELANCLKDVRPALGDRDYIKSLVCFCFDGKKVRAFNDIIGIEAPCDVKINGAVEGEALIGLLNTSHGKEVNFDKVDDDLKINCGSTDAIMPLLDSEEFLFDFPNLKPKIKLIFDDDFNEGMVRCLLSTTDDEMTSTGGVTLVVGDGVATLYSSDYKSITKFMLQQDVDGEKVVIFPAMFCKTLLRAVKELKGVGTVIGLGNKCAVAIFSNGMKIYTKLCDDTKLDFQKQIRDILPSPINIINIPKTLYASIHQSVFILDGTKQELAEIAIKKKRLTLTTKSDKMQAKRVTKLKYVHDNVKIFCEPFLLERVLKHCDMFCVTEKVTVLTNGERYLYVIANKFSKR